MVEASYSRYMKERFSVRIWLLGDVVFVQNYGGPANMSLCLVIDYIFYAT